MRCCFSYLCFPGPEITGLCYPTLKYTLNYQLFAKDVHRYINYLLKKLEKYMLVANFKNNYKIDKHKLYQES